MDKDVLDNLMKRFPMKRLNNGLIRLCPARLTFSHLGEAKESDEEGGKPKYNAGCIFPIGADISILVEDTKTCLTAAHGADALKAVGAGKIAWPIKKQEDMTRQDGEMWGGMEAGGWYVDLRTTIKPSCVNLRGQPIDASKFYDGCYVLATTSPYADTYVDKKKNMSKRYVTLSLGSILFLADDEALGGSFMSPDEAFGDIYESSGGDAPLAASTRSNGATAGEGASGFDFGS